MPGSPLQTQRQGRGEHENADRGQGGGREIREGAGGAPRQLKPQKGGKGKARTHAPPGRARRLAQTTEGGENHEGPDQRPGRVRLFRQVIEARPAGGANQETIMPVPFSRTLGSLQADAGRQRGLALIVGALLLPWL